MEREARQKEQEEAAKRRRQELEERARKAEEAERRRLQQEEARLRPGEARRRWAEEDARREQERVEREARVAREQAEREERERQSLEVARVWWGRLPPQQTELFAVVAEYAWRESSLRGEVPEKPVMWPQYARGVPVRVADKRRTLYGTVRPCPGLVAACPTLAEELVLVRSAHEARELAAVLPQGRILHLDLPEHEQLTMI